MQQRTSSPFRVLAWPALAVALAIAGQAQAQGKAEGSSPPSEVSRGVQRVERELFESSLRSGRTVLELLGLPAHEARRQAMRFRRHNLALFERMHPHYQDRRRLIAVVKEGRQQLEEQMARERADALERQRRGGERTPGRDKAC